MQYYASLLKTATATERVEIQKQIDALEELKNAFELNTHVSIPIEKIRPIDNSKASCSIMPTC